MGEIPYRQNFAAARIHIQAWHLVNQCVRCRRVLRVRVQMKLQISKARYLVNLLRGLDLMDGKYGTAFGCYKWTGEIRIYRVV